MDIERRSGWPIVLECGVCAALLVTCDGAISGEIDHGDARAWMFGRLMLGPLSGWIEAWS